MFDQKDGRHELVTATSTQQLYPWRTTVRSVFQFIVALSAAAPVVYLAVTGESLEAATGAVAVALTAMTYVTKVMAHPKTDEFLKRFAPWLASEPKA
jgi:hypothetical protein